MFTICIAFLEILIQLNGISADPIHYDQEKHLENVTQLTFGGVNAEAYFSFDGNELIFQATNKKLGTYDCDQIFRLRLDQPNAQPEMISDGRGRTTCGFFLKDKTHYIYATTAKSGDKCPVPICRRPNPPKACNQPHAYLWDIFHSYEIVMSDEHKKLTFLTNNDAYDAEGVISPDGKTMLFTSDRSNDLQLHLMDLETGDVRQLTDDIGYDGGGFFSPDGQRVVYRAYHPADEQSVAEYAMLLLREAVSPSSMELFTINVNGTNKQQVTKLGGANWAPYFHPDGKRIIFSSNHHSQATFNLFLVDDDGRNVKRITYDPHFDSFPMFSPDGKKLVFISARNNTGTHAMNIFIADWQPNGVQPTIFRQTLWPTVVLCWLLVSSWAA